MSEIVNKLTGEPQVEAASPKSSPLGVLNKTKGLILTHKWIKWGMLGLGVLISMMLLMILTKSLFAPKSPDVINLTYWGFWPENQTLTNLFQEFETANPNIKIKYLAQSKIDYRERLQAAINRGQEPDIFRFHSKWTPMLSRELAPIPLDIMSITEFEKTFYPVVRKDLKLGSQYVGIPLMFDGLALFYDPQKLEGKAIPQTWDELKSLASDLATYEGPRKTLVSPGIALGNTANVDHWSDIVGLLLLQNSADPLLPSSAPAQDALKFYQQFENSDQLWNQDYPSSTIAFAKGIVPLIIAPAYKIAEIKQIKPDFYFQTAPVPQLPNTSVHWSSYWVEGVSQKSSLAEQQAAFKLLKFLVQPENLRTLSQMTKLEQGVGEIYSRVDMGEELINDPLLGAFIQSAPSAQSWYLAGNTNDNGLNDQVIDIYSQFVNKSGDPGEVEQLTTELYKILNKYGLRVTNPAPVPPRI